MQSRTFNQQEKRKRKQNVPALCILHSCNFRTTVWVREGFTVMRMCIWSRPIQTIVFEPIRSTPKWLARRPPLKISWLVTENMAVKVTDFSSKLCLSVPTNTYSFSPIFRLNKIHSRVFQKLQIKICTGERTDVPNSLKKKGFVWENVTFITEHWIYHSSAQRICSTRM